MPEEFLEKNKTDDLAVFVDESSPQEESEREPSHAEERAAKHIFGFWIYLMTDLVMFAAMFATFIVLRGNTFGGPSNADIVSLPFVYTETMILLVSSFTMGLTMVAAHKNDVAKTLVSLGVTFLLGVSFISMELYEFSHLIAEGHTWQTSAFLSGFFSLVGMHGFHILIGLLWIAVSFVIVARKKLTIRTVERLTLLSLFWHFLDLIWIFIFTIVYLMGII